MISRRTFIKSALGCGIGITSVGGYSRLLEPRWVEINIIDIKINALPKQFEGMTIAQLSDIHHCKYVPKEFIRKCVRKVNALNPDIIVLTGDYTTKSPVFLFPVAEELAELKAKEGIPESELFTTKRERGRTVYIYSDEYYARYHKLLNGMVERRLKDSVRRVASYWYTAWVNAGKPDLMN